MEPSLAALCDDRRPVRRQKIDKEVVIPADVHNGLRIGFREHKAGVVALVCIMSELKVRLRAHLRAAVSRIFEIVEAE